MGRSPVVSDQPGAANQANFAPPPGRIQMLDDLFGTIKFRRLTIDCLKVDQSSSQSITSKFTLKKKNLKIR